MQISTQDLFCEDLASGNQASTSSTNTFDWGAHGNDIDYALRWFVLCTKTGTSAGDATLVITWQTSANNSDWTTLYTSATIPLADIVSGSYLLDNLPLPTGLLRYNKLVFTSAGANWTVAPTFTAAVVRNDMPIA